MQRERHWKLRAKESRNNWPYCKFYRTVIYDCYELQKMVLLLMLILENAITEDLRQKSK